MLLQMVSRWSQVYTVSLPSPPPPSIPTHTPWGPWWVSAAGWRWCCSRWSPGDHRYTQCPPPPLHPYTHTLRSLVGICSWVKMMLLQMVSRWSQVYTVSLPPPPPPPPPSIPTHTPWGPWWVSAVGWRWCCSRWSPGRPVRRTGSRRPCCAGWGDPASWASSAGSRLWGWCTGPGRPWDSQDISDSETGYFR